MKKKSNNKQNENNQSLREIRMQEKRIRTRRFITFTILEILTLGLIFGYTVFFKRYSRIQRYTYAAEDVQNNDISVENIKKMEGYWNIAVFGVDSRNSSVTKGNNSDVIMIVSLNRATGDIKIASVYRDTYLDTGNGRLAKINNAYAVGGPEQAVRALNKNLDLNITDYITFNWGSVATAINLLGGVDIEVTKAEMREINGYITETVRGTDIGSTHLKGPGMQHLDGIQAVAYARLRHMDTDFERTARQRRVLQQMFDKAKVADPRLLIGVMDEVLPMVATNLKWQDGLDVIGSIGNYRIAETTGFPEKRGDSDMGTRGWNVIPKTLTSNVTDLHHFLFENEEYTVSNTVKSIDEKIMSSSAAGGRKTKTSDTSPKSGADTDEKSSAHSYETNADGQTVKSTKNTKENETKKGESGKKESAESVESKDGTKSSSEDNTKSTKSGNGSEGPTSASKESKESVSEVPKSEATKESTKETTKESTKAETQASKSDNINDAIVVPNKPSDSNEVTPGP